MEVKEELKHGFLSKLSPSSIGTNKEIIERLTFVLASLDLPTTRFETWKYTRLAKVKNSSYVKPKSISYEAPLRSFGNGNGLVFINGELNVQLSAFFQTDGVTFKLLSTHENGLKSTKTSDCEIFDVINTLYLNEGIELIIEKNVILEKPIDIVFVHQGLNQLLNFKVKIKVESGSSAIVNFVSMGANDGGLTNVISEIDVKSNATLCINKIQQETVGGVGIFTEYVDQERDSTFTINTFSFHSGIIRNNLNVNFNGPNATAHLHGAYLPTNNEHIDNHTIVDHRVPHCNSNELYKGVIDGKGTAVFNGKVYVRKDAQKTNAFQSNGNVLMSDDASVNSKPELEIYADDVKCSHGSTTGQLDEEAIFYLRSRGLSEEASRKLLVSAFIKDVLDKVELPEVKSYVEKLISAKYGWEF